MLRKILVFASLVEVGTGLALLLDPGLVVRLLAGIGEAGAVMPLARFPGIALLALGVACWPGGRGTEAGSPTFLGMLLYNVLVACFLADLFIAGHIGGILLWPGVGVHAGVALLLLWTWRQSSSTENAR